MAMLFNYSANNIDTGALPGGYANIFGSPTVGSGDGPQGINTIHCNGNTNSVFLPNVAININGTGMVVGAGFNVTAFGSARTNLHTVGSNVSEFLQSYGIAVSSDGSMQIFYVDNTGLQNVIASSASGTFTFGNRHEVEMEISSFASSGTITIYLDGIGVVNLIAVTGVHLAALSDGATIHSVACGGSNPGGGGNPVSTPIVMDSTYVLDLTGSAPCNGPLGPAISVPMIPNAPGQESAWTPNGASLGWECISEIPPDGDTTYISDATPNDEESVSLTTPMGIIGVYAVSVIADQRQDSAGGGRTVALGLGNGTTRSYGVPWGLGTTYKMNTTAFSFNPFTSSPWALADMTALEAAAKLAS